MNRNIDLSALNWTEVTELPGASATNAVAVHLGPRIMAMSVDGPWVQLGPISDADTCRLLQARIIDWQQRNLHKEGVRLTVRMRRLDNGYAIFMRKLARE